MTNEGAKRAKILFFIVKYANLWVFCCRRRCSCLSSLLAHYQPGGYQSRDRKYESALLAPIPLRVTILRWRKKKKAACACGTSAWEKFPHNS